MEINNGLLCHVSALSLELSVTGDGLCEATRSAHDSLSAARLLAAQEWADTRELYYHRMRLQR
jgi:hypothetical protein